MEVAEAVRTRRAGRALRDAPVDKEKMDALVEAVRLSASCFNNQPWRLVVAVGEESLASVKEALARGNAWAIRAAFIVAVAAKDTDDCQLSDRRDYYLFDCGLAVGQLELMATELGLIAHPIAGYDPAKVRAALRIPEEYTVITLVVCGHPGGDDALLSDKQKAAERERPDRKPVGENVFLDRWGQPYQPKTA